MYSLDLKNISLESYGKLLAGKDLLPGRRMLHQSLKENFKRIASAGIGNLSDLKKALSSPDKINSFSKTTGVSGEYLILLKREAGSLEQKPVPVKSFLHMDAETLECLLGAGVKTSRDYYDLYLASPDEAARVAGIGPAQAKELFCLCDLLRVNGVGATAAQTFFEAGYTSVSGLAKANANEMLRAVTAVNSQKNYYNAKLGEKDMEFCIDYAKLLMKFSSSVQGGRSHEK